MPSCDGRARRVKRRGTLLALGCRPARHVPPPSPTPTHTHTTATHLQHVEGCCRLALFHQHLPIGQQCGFAVLGQRSGQCFALERLEQRAAHARKGAQHLSGQACMRTGLLQSVRKELYCPNCVCTASMIPTWQLFSPCPVAAGLPRELAEPVKALATLLQCLTLH